MDTWRTFKRVCLGAMVLAFAGAAHADTYPSKPIRLIVPWPAGGGVDTSARIISQPLSERLGQTIVVENQAGAAGNIGTALAAKEKPDGYTLLMGSCRPTPSTHTSIRAWASIRSRTSLPSHCIHGTKLPCRSSQLPSQHGAGVHRSRQSQSGQAQHGFGRRGIVPTPVRRDVHERDQDRCRARRLQGHEPGRAALIAGQVDFMLDPPTALPFVRRAKLKALAVAAHREEPGPAQRSHLG